MAALLTFILSSGPKPIILDQLEDNLASTLTCKLLVNWSRETKLRCRSIVVSLKRNIAVQGVADLVVPHDFMTARTIIALQFSLRGKAGRNEICRVMEGGPESFKTRYNRIIPSSRTGT